MSDFSDDPYVCDAAYEGDDFFEVADWKGMASTPSTGYAWQAPVRSCNSTVRKPCAPSMEGEPFLE